MGLFSTTDARFIRLTLVLVLTHGAAVAGDVMVTVDTAHPQWEISRMLVGLHQVYCFTPDAVYADGRIAAWAKRVGIGTSRFPGGTVVKHWDWKNPSGAIQGDPWDPGWDPAQRVDPTKWMSLDEYLAFVTASGIRPMLGVNTYSGAVYKRETESIDRAVQMVRYVRARGFGGAIWYLGNEEIGIHGGLERYAATCGRYARAMKAVDPDIVVFLNANSATVKSLAKIFANDGGMIDGLETHGKWPFGGDPKGLQPGTFEEWINEVPLRDRKHHNRAWREAANRLRAAAARLGRPGFLIADNEYGLGKRANMKGFNRYTSHLLLTEMLMEHFIGNWYSACFWDMTLGSERGLLDAANDYRFNPFHIGMELLAQAQGGRYLGVTTTRRQVHGFAARDPDGVLVYLLNKTLDEQRVDIRLGHAAPAVAIARMMRDTADHYGECAPLPLRAAGDAFQAVLPPLTFAQFSFLFGPAE